jgi:hypothetical protein
MAKHTTSSRRNVNSKHTNVIPKATTKSSPIRPNTHQLKRPSTPPAKDKSNDDDKIITVSPTPKKPKASKSDSDNQHHFETLVKKDNQMVLLALLSVPLTTMFTNMHKSYIEAIQAFKSIDHSFVKDKEDKELKLHLQRGIKMMSLKQELESKDCYNLFKQAYTSLEPEFMDPGNGDEIRNFGLNLAASAPLILVDSSKFDDEGNLFPSQLAHAWLGSTTLLGCIHLSYDLQLQKNRLAAQTFDDMHEDNNAYIIPQYSVPLVPWTNLPAHG